MSIFLSYARENRDQAARLESELRTEKLPVWRDPPLVEGDPFWRDRIARQLSQSPVMVVLWSKDAALSPWVDQEIRSFGGALLLVTLDHSLPLPPVADPSRLVRVSPAETLSQLKQLLRSASQQEADPDNHPVSSPDDESIRRQRVQKQAQQAEWLAGFEKRYAGRARLQRAPGDDRLYNLFDGTQLQRVPNGQPNNSTFMGLTPVTNARYRRFVDDTGSPSPAVWGRPEFCHPDAPVVGISWYEACAYAAWAGGTLPTEEDWVCAARSGLPGAQFATTSGQISPDLAHYGLALAVGAPLPVKQFPPNPAGFYGMCGNTWDWCLSSWGDYHAIRGGGYMDSAGFCRIESSYRNAPIDRDCCVGFRLKIQLA